MKIQHNSNFNSLLELCLFKNFRDLVLYTGSLAVQMLAGPVDTQQYPQGGSLKKNKITSNLRLDI